jgi:hypothetical protein
MPTKNTKKKRDVLGRIWLGWLAVVMLVMLYGVIRYPHPIRYRDGAYFNSIGQQVTEQQFHNFEVWERCLMGAGAVAAAITIPLAIVDRRTRKRNVR